MESYLDRIVGATRDRVDSARRRRPLPGLERDAGAQPPPRDFLGAVRREGMSLVAEFKRRSPSAGPIAEVADPAQVAAAYERGGAAAVSVLTEPDFFGGSLDDLDRARGACGLPVLRKDFVIDPYQLVEARAAGADAALLIVAALRDAGLFAELAGAARELRLPVLVEVHDERELDAAFGADADLVGVNQRDLRTFEVDTSLAARLRPRVPREVPVIAESGISSRADVEALAEAGVDGILVGEHLMRSEDPARAAAELIGRSVQEDG